jgi:hypothetical protein
MIGVSIHELVTPAAVGRFADGPAIGAVV